MDRVFLDANVLFSAAYKADSSLLQLWKLADVTLCSSQHALEEARANLDGQEQRVRLKKLSEKLRLVEANEGSLPRGVVLPGKDVPILLGAIAAQATHLLTGDIRHFGSYFGKKIAGIAVARPGAYLKQRADKI